MSKSLVDDPKRGQYSVETGTGRIDQLTERDRNAEVVMNAEGLRLPVKGWVDKATPAYQVALAARRAGARVGYRIEVRRKPDQPTDVPLEEIDPITGRLRDLVDLVVLEADDDVDVPSFIEPRPTPTCGRCGQPGHLDASCDVLDPDAAPGDLDDPHGGDDHDPGWLARAQADARDARSTGEPEPEPPADLDPPADDGPPPVDEPPATDTRRPRVAEAKPWELYNSDGSPNVGSWEVLSTTATVHLAHKLLMAHNRERQAAEGGEVAAPTPGQLRALSKRLLAAADRTQAAVRRDGHYDRMDNSHARARGCVRLALDVHPVPWGAEGDALDAWVDELTAYATELLRVGLVAVHPDVDWWPRP